MMQIKPRSSTIVKLKDCLKKRSLSDMDDQTQVDAVSSSSMAACGTDEGEPPAKRSRRMKRVRPLIKQEHIDLTGDNGDEAQSDVYPLASFADMKLLQPPALSELKTRQRRSTRLPVIDECLNLTNGQLESFDDAEVHAMWNVIMAQLTQGNEFLGSDGAMCSHQVMQALEYFKHIAQYPNAPMHCTSKAFWISQLLIETKRLMVEHPKIMKKFNIFQLLVLFMHVLFHKTFNTKLALEESSGVREALRDLERVLYMDEDCTCLQQMVELNIGRSIEKYLNMDSYSTMSNIVKQWLPFFSTSYKTVLAKNYIMPLLLNQISMWTFPDDVMQVVVVLRPWQEVLGGRMMVIQHEVARHVLKSLQQGSWKAGDVRVQVLLKGLVHLVDKEVMLQFLNEHALPTINKDLAVLAQNCDQFTEHFLKEWNNILRWSVLLNEDRIIEAIIASFFPHVFVTFARKLQKDRCTKSAQTWLATFRSLFSGKLENTVIISNYIRAMETFFKAIKNGEKHVPIFVDLTEQHEPIDLRCSPSHQSRSSSTPPLTTASATSADATAIISPAIEVDTKDDGPTGDTIASLLATNSNVFSTSGSDQHNDCSRSSMGLDAELEHPDTNIVTGSDDTKSNNDDAGAEACNENSGSPDAPSVSSPACLPSTSPTAVNILHNLSSSLKQLQQQTSRVVTYKQLLQHKAEELGVSFHAMPKKMQDGHQVYRFGRANIYIRCGKVCVQSVDKWIPIPISSITDYA